MAISTDPFLAEAAQSCLQLDLPPIDSTLDQLHDRLSGLKQAYWLHRSRLIGLMRGNATSASGNSRMILIYPELRLHVLQHKRAVLSDLHRDTSNGPIELTLLTPLKLKFDGVERIGWHDLPAHRSPSGIYFPCYRLGHYRVLAPKPCWYAGRVAMFCF